VLSEQAKREHKKLDQEITTLDYIEEVFTDIDIPG
jgi:hypothetical protein